MLFQFNSGPDAVKEFERRLRVSDLVIKFLTVRIDETLKRLDKRKKHREKRARQQSRRAAPAAAPAVGSASRCWASRWQECQGDQSWRNQRKTRQRGAKRPPAATRPSLTQKKQYFRRKKVCRFCVEKIDDINYKDVKHAQRVHRRARQDCSAPHFGRLRAASAPAERRHQEGAQYRAAAVRGSVLSEEIIMEVILREDVEKLGAARRRW